MKRLDATQFNIVSLTVKRVEKVIYRACELFEFIEVEFNHRKVYLDILMFKVSKVHQEVYEVSLS